MTKCSIQVCKNYKNRNRRPFTFLEFYKIPDNAKTKRIWTEIIQVSQKDFNWKPKQNSVVCSEHFCPEDIAIDEKYKKRRLKKDTIPTKALFLTDHNGNLYNYPEVPLTKTQLTHAGCALIYRVYNYLDNEYKCLKWNNDCDLTSLSKIVERTANATGVAEETVLQILEEVERKSKKKFNELVLSDHNYTEQLSVTKSKKVKRLSQNERGTWYRSNLDTSKQSGNQKNVDLNCERDSLGNRTAAGAKKAKRAEISSRKIPDTRPMSNLIKPTNDVLTTNIDPKCQKNDNSSTDTAEAKKSKKSEMASWNIPKTGPMSNLIKPTKDVPTRNIDTNCQKIDDSSTDTAEDEDDLIEKHFIFKVNKDSVKDKELDKDMTINADFKLPVKKKKKYYYREKKRKRVKRVKVWPINNSVTKEECTKESYTMVGDVKRENGDNEIQINKEENEEEIDGDLVMKCEVFEDDLIPSACNEYNVLNKTRKHIRLKQESDSESKNTLYLEVSPFMTTREENNKGDYKINYDVMDVVKEDDEEEIVVKTEDIEYNFAPNQFTNHMTKEPHKIFETT